MSELEFYCDGCDEYFEALEDTVVCPECGAEVSPTESAILGGEKEKK